MKIERTLRIFFDEKLEDGQVKTHFDKVIRRINYGVEDTEKGVIFFFDGRKSKPVELVYDRQWAWKTTSKSIRTNNPEKFMEYMSDELWDAYLYDFCELYATGRMEDKSA